jgi:hypothetical protein
VRPIYRRLVDARLPAIYEFVAVFLGTRQWGPGTSTDPRV